MLLLVVWLLPVVSGAHPSSSLLWKISGHGLQHPSYIYGTIHSPDRRAFTFHDIVVEHIKDCDAFGMEVRLDEFNPFSILGDLQMPGDTTLEMLLGDSSYHVLEKFVRDSFKIELGMFAKIKPMFLAGLMDSQGQEEDSAEVLDESLMNQAKSLGKELIGIETIAEQIHAIDLIPLKEQAKMLLDETEQGDSSEMPFEDLLDVYKSGDLDSLYGYYKQGELSNAFNKSLIIDRNHRMADRIDSIIRKKTLLVAVGALHLPGDEGVLNLLRKKGYELSPLWKQ